MPRGWHRKPLKFHEFEKRLKLFGVVVMEGARGKGSEVILLRPNIPGSKQGPMYPIKHHSRNDEVKIPVIEAALRNLKIDSSDFWSAR